jgi:hypothetical protein
MSEETRALTVAEIDCRCDPFIDPKSELSLEPYNHDRSPERVTWNPDKVILVKMSGHRNGHGFNDCVCMWLRKHLEHIPGSCRGKVLFFPKTTFLDEEKEEVYRCLKVGKNGECKIIIVPVKSRFDGDDVMIHLAQ